MGGAGVGVVFVRVDEGEAAVDLADTIAVRVVGVSDSDGGAGTGGLCHLVTPVPGVGPDAFVGGIAVIIVGEGAGTHGGDGVRVGVVAGGADLMPY